MRLGGSLLCGLALLFALARPAAAEPVEPKRVLLVEHELDPFLERVGAEISGLGFALVRSDAAGALEEAARSEHAVAAIRVLPSRKGVEVWMSDATSGRSLLRQVIVDESDQGPNQGLVALQTAELLRTSLFTEPPSSSASEASSPMRAAPARMNAAPSPSPALEMGAQAALGMLYSPGGADSALQLGLSVHRSFSPRWGAALDLSAPLRRASVTGLEGSTRVGTYLAGAAVFTRFYRPNTPFFSTLGVGAALLVITFEGDARAPLVASSERALTGAGYLRAEAGLEPTSWLRLGLRGLAGVSAARVRVEFAGNDAGSWGRGFAAALALAEVPWH